MLGEANAVAMIAVKDLGPARTFYENKLGLKAVSTEGEDVVTYRSGGTVLNVYRSDYAGTNKATSVVWDVGTDLESAAKALKDKGVSFERYDMPGLKQKGDVYVADKMKVAWFKDPDGNILSLVGH
jgi:catechol 2,3-dioxygenase-like lactoylglutathione lyase family enzyme